MLAIFTIVYKMKTNEEKKERIHSDIFKLFFLSHQQSKHKKLFINYNPW